MYKLRSHQSGFAALEALLIVVIVGIIGFAGWYVYNAQNDIDKNLTPTNSETPPIKKKAENKTLPETKYLSIKEWGVRIPLSSADNGAYYTVSDGYGGSTADPTNLTVYTTEADNIVGPAGVSCKGEFVAYLLRLPVDDPRWQPPEYAADGNVEREFSQRIVIGKYRYALATAKHYGPECFETTKDGGYEADEATAMKFGEIVDAFSAGFTKIETAN